MPRRGTEAVTFVVPPKKKIRPLIEDTLSLDISYTDDEALPPGIVFRDVQKKRWRIGKPIGRGSFGRIYLASDDIEKEVTKANARYVVKIEPHTNGPLFVEIHCLIRTAQADGVKEWRLQKKQKHLGMPVFIASGSFTDESSGQKFRFLILPRYDIDLQKIIARTRVLDQKNVLKLALQILDVLEYLHDQGYTHSDIKSSNLMLGFDGGRISKVQLPKPTPSFQKETKELAVLAGKQRKAKTGKSRSSNYYVDEDFVMKDRSATSSDDELDKDKKLTSVKNKLRNILSDKECRTLHRHHAFNLRQLSSYVNYEDLNSSVCSDQSYQKLLDDFGSKQHLFYSSDEGFHDDPKLQKRQNSKHYPTESKINLDDETAKEAILSQSPGQIYLLDYGLASKFLDSDGNHKDFAMDARKAHDGTLEYSSRDSHIGAHSRRSDLETLAFNLLDWLTATLPWKTTEMLAEPDLVHALKKNFMSDIKLLLKTCFKTEFYPQFMEKYLEYVTSLDFAEKPDYDFCRNIFRQELMKTGFVDNEVMLNFAESSISPMNRKKLMYAKRFGKKTSELIPRGDVQKAYERENIFSLESDLKLELLKQTLNSSSDGIRKPCASRNFFISDADLVARLKKTLMPHDILGKKLSPKNLRSKKKKGIQKRKGRRTHRNSIGKFGNFMGSARQFTWAEILAGNPEDIIRKERNATAANSENDDDDESCKYRIRKLSNASSDCNSDTQSPILQKDYLKGTNPTYAMKEVIANLKKKISGKALKDSEDVTDGLEGYTPPMVRLYRLKQKREEKERIEAAKQLCVEVKEQRCTRSTKSTSNKSKTKKKVAKVIEKCVENPVEDAVSTTKNNNRSISTRSKNTKNVLSKKEVKVVEPLPEKVTPKKAIPAKRERQTTVPNNRRRLRSSIRTVKYC